MSSPTLSTTSAQDAALAATIAADQAHADAIGAGAPALELHRLHVAALEAQLAYCSAFGEDVTGLEGALYYARRDLARVAA